MGSPQNEKLLELLAVSLYVDAIRNRTCPAVNFTRFILWSRLEGSNFESLGVWMPTLPGLSGLGYTIQESSAKPFEHSYRPSQYIGALG